MKQNQWRAAWRWLANFSIGIANGANQRRKWHPASKRRKAGSVMASACIMAKNSGSENGNQRSVAKKAAKAAGGIRRQRGSGNGEIKHLAAWREKSIGVAQA